MNTLGLHDQEFKHREFKHQVKKESSRHDTDYISKSKFQNFVETHKYTFRLSAVNELNHDWCYKTSYVAKFS